MPFADFVGMVSLPNSSDFVRIETASIVAWIVALPVAVTATSPAVGDGRAPSIDASVSRSTSLRARPFVIVTNGVVGTVIMFVASAVSVESSLRVDDEAAGAELSRGSRRRRSPSCRR